MKRISGLLAVGLWLFAFSAAAQGLTLPYSGSATTSSAAFSVANYYSLSGGPYAIVAAGYNQSSALNATSTNGYGVVSSTSAGWASTYTTNASGSWGTYTHSYGTAGL